MERLRARSVGARPVRTGFWVSTSCLFVSDSHFPVCQWGVVSPTIADRLMTTYGLVPWSTSYIPTAPQELLDLLGAQAMCREFVDRAGAAPRRNTAQLQRRRGIRHGAVHVAAGNGTV